MKRLPYTSLPVDKSTFLPRWEWLLTNFTHHSDFLISWIKYILIAISLSLLIIQLSTSLSWATFTLNWSYRSISKPSRQTVLFGVPLLIIRQLTRLQASRLFSTGASIFTAIRHYLLLQIPSVHALIFRRFLHYPKMLRNISDPRLFKYPKTILGNIHAFSAGWLNRLHRVNRL